MDGTWNAAEGCDRENGGQCPAEIPADVRLARNCQTPFDALILKVVQVWLSDHEENISCDERVTILYPWYPDGAGWNGNKPARSFL